MQGYLGEIKTKISESSYALFTKEDWVLTWIEMYSGIDGSHHKDWLLDQIARILNGTKVKLKIAKWDNGTSENRLRLGKPSKEYLDWVIKMKEGEDGPESYDYNTGIAP